jgi:lysophospholipase L1-like esterase
MGFRDDEPDPGAALRIVTLGDSIVFGAGVRAKDRFTEVMERSLSESLGAKVEVDAWGVNGTETSYHRQLYAEMAPQLPAGLAIVGFCLNDVVPVSAHALYRKTERKSRDTMSLADRLGEEGYSLHYLFLIRLSHTGLEALCRRLWPESPPTEAEVQRRAYRDFLARHWSNDEDVAQLGRELASIRDEAATRGAAVLLVVFPYRFQFATGDFRPQERLAELTNELGIATVDLRGPFAEAMKTGPVYLPGDDCHPDARGHRVAAEAALPAVREILARKMRPAH